MSNESVSVTLGLDPEGDLSDPYSIQQKRDPTVLSSYLRTSTTTDGTVTFLLGWVLTSVAFFGSSVSVLEL